MKMFLFTILFLFAVSLAMMQLATLWIGNRVEALYPPNGEFAEIDGIRLHYTDHPAADGADLPPLVFIHGASGNLRDLEAPIVERLKGRARLVFVDRPGHGYSQGWTATGKRAHLPDGQANLIAGLLARIGIGEAIVVGHSYGGAVAAAFAVEHPEKTAGVVFLAPATHPWPGGGVTWYYDVAMLPVIGPLFVRFVAIPAGWMVYEDAVRGVFKPNRLPADYVDKSGSRLVLRVPSFTKNALDVSSLYGFVQDYQKRYREITAPVSIITGDSDDVVLAGVHSTGLNEDIPNSRIVWLENTGHIPAWIHPETVIEEIERVSQSAVASAR
jgi:pimeloyl-ACP methyl ester carboxylesterase